MKKITKILAAVMLVIAVAVGAYASAQKSAAVIDVFYIDSNEECVAVKANTICAISSIPQCVEAILDPVTALPLGFNAQIYATRTSAGACIDPYFQQ